jgi:hypothetical protein
VVFIVTVVTYAMPRALRPDLYGADAPSVLSAVQEQHRACFACPFEG